MHNTARNLNPMKLELSIPDHAGCYVYSVVVAYQRVTYLDLTKYS
jgi:hypothetical protein